MDGLNTQIVRGRVLLVDDDVLFGETMLALCKSNGLALTYVSSVREAYKLDDWNYDVAIIDYDLGPVTGVQLSHFLQHYLKPPAVILVSAYSDLEQADWPSCVKGFIPKSQGPSYILYEAMKAVPHHL